jgi:hypothetical protein
MALWRFGSVAEPPPDRERLRRLTERLDVAAQRAERLLTESVLAAATPPPPDQPPPGRDSARSEPDAMRSRPVAPDGDPLGGADSDPLRPPPSGWRQPPLDDRSDRDRWLDSDELELLMSVLAGVRDRIPAELRRRLADAVRELLMAFRALIDWYLERSDRPAPGSSDVEDIPIL